MIERIIEVALVVGGAALVALALLQARPEPVIVRAPDVRIVNVLPLCSCADEPLLAVEGTP